MTQDEMNALMTERFELEAAGEIDWQARAESAEVDRDMALRYEEVLQARVAELEAQLAAAQPAIEAWAQYQADNERRARLQEEMIAEGLIKRPFWQ